MTREEIISRVCDNCFLPNEADKLGIFKFAKTFFPLRFKNEFATIHYKIMILFFQMINPNNKYDFERRRYLLIHRQAAKTTLATFLWPVYNIFLKGKTIKVYESMLNWDFKDFKDIVADKVIEIPIWENFIIISSETATQAENFVMSIKDVIEENSTLANIFGEKNPQIIDMDEQSNRKVRSKIWRGNAFITKDRTIVYGLGAGQRVRGRNVFGFRPSTIIVDDMYSQYNTKTEETRKKFDYWFDAEAMNSLDNEIGKIIWLGTMVHPDTVVKSFRTSDNWKGLEQPIMSMDDLQRCVRECMVNGRFVLPEANSVKYQLLANSINSYSWKDRHDLYSILMKYKEGLEKNTLSYFYQEFMNEPIPPEMLVVKPENFYYTEMDKYIKDDRQIVKFKYDGLTWKGVANIYVGLDPASSEVASSDDTAIVVAGLAHCYPTLAGYNDEAMYKRYPEGRIFPIILHVEGGKYSIYNYESMPGMVESTLALDRRFKLEYINIETNAQQIQIAREMKTTFRKANRFTTIWDEYNQGKKANRIMTTILPFIQYYNVIICDKNYEHYINRIYNQLITLGVADHDDYVDAWSIAVKNCSIPQYTPDFVNEQDNPIKVDDRWTQLVKAYGDDAWMYY